MLKQTFQGALASLIVIFAILIFLLPTPPAQSDPETGDTNALIVRNARIFNGEASLENADLLVQNGLISAIGPDLAAPAGAIHVDGTGLNILPGLIDAHTHTYGTALEDSLRFGVTTNLDMFMSADLLAEAKTDRDSVAPTNRADLFSAGTLATVDGGHGTQYGLPIETLASPENAAEWVRRRKAEGSDFIKLVYMPGQSFIPSLDLETAEAVIDAAHSEGLAALAHISTQAAAMDMVSAGIDGLVHLFADELVSEEFTERARDANVFIVPTLAVLAAVDGAGEGAVLAANPSLAPYFGPGQAANLNRAFGVAIPGFDLQTALTNTRKLHAAGIPILAGSDAPNPGTTHGASLHQELELLVRAGLSPAEALIAATAAPASRFGLTGRGVLRAGARADFILIAGNPLDDITSTRDITAIYKNGQAVSREIIVEPTDAAPVSATLGTFDNGPDAPDGLIWTSTDDGMAGGNSTTEVTSDDRGYLHIEATITPGFPYPWAGAFLTLQDPDAGPRSLADFSELMFQVKGTPGIYRAMMFDTAIAGAPPTVTFEVNQDWQDVSISLADFDGFSAEVFVGLAIVAGPGRGEFQYQIDNVILK